MTKDHWLESASTTLAAILAADHGVHIDRSLLAATLDRRRSNLMHDLNLPAHVVESMLNASELRAVAGLMANARRARLVAVA